MKIVKRIVVVLVLCLAVVGVFSLLKKAPILAPSEEDRTLLLETYGKTTSATPSESGLSGVMMNVEGAPPITGFEMTGASSAPPAFMTGASTPAPAFDEAPPFVPAAPAAPMASPYRSNSGKLDEAPAFEAPPLPQISPVEPVTVPLKEPVPVSVVPPGTSVYECSVLEQIVPAAKPSLPRTEAAPPFQEVLLAWNGPVTEVINMPSSDSSEPQEGCGVLGEVAPERKTPSGTVWTDPESQQESLKNETPIVALSPYKRLPVVMEAPEIKIIPAVEKESEILSDSAPAESIAAVTPKPAEAPTREGYHNTSVRKNIAFSDPLQLEKAKEPIISFSAPKQDATVDVPEARPTPPAPAETTAVPFAKSDTHPVQPPERVRASVPETDLSKVLRPTVTRFVKAQSTLANSGNPVKMRNAFIQLSKLYEQSELNDAERSYMRPLLDRLALSVVYSRNIHILEPGYVVRSGETIETIAESYQISPELLRKINGLSATRSPAPGTELKVVQGRFDAKISRSRSELTLLLGGLYAGCFPILPKGPLGDLQGEFYVTAKTDSPHGRVLTLNNEVMIGDEKFSGTPSAIRLKDQDFGELFDILTEMSVIVFEN